MDMLLFVGSLVGLALIVVGLIGVIFPALPGPIVIWLGIVVWSLANRLVIDWPWLAALFLLVVASWLSGAALTATISRRSGASWSAVAASVIGGLLGALAGTAFIPIPVAGTVIGGVAGAFVAVAAVEYRTSRSLRPAVQAGAAYLTGCLTSKLVEGAIAVTMLVVFVWRGFLA